MKALFGITVVALVAFAVFALDLPSRIADLGSGNLNTLVAPTTTASFGKTITLDGRAQRPALAVAATPPVRVRAATRIGASKGHMLLGVPLTIENIGRTPFEVSMGIETTVVDARGKTYRSTSTVTRLRGRHALRVARLAPRAEIRGVVVFDVPRGTRLTTARLTVGSGLTRTAEWTTKK